MSESELDTERVTVRTYLPAYQREAWDGHAEELGMSRSEFVKTMVQAGRRIFDGDVEVSDDGTGNERGAAGDGTTGDAATGSDGSPGAAPGTDLESQVVEALAAGEYRSWDDLLAAVTDDIEDRLEATLQDLQAEGRVRYSGRNGGYTLDE
jgi:hypothetical protein